MELDALSRLELDSVHLDVVDVRHELLRLSPGRISPHQCPFARRQLGAVVFGAGVPATGARAKSAVVAALFALHPLHVESVAWVAERKDVLSTFFGFLSLLVLCRYATRGRLWRLARLGAVFRRQPALEADVGHAPVRLVAPRLLALGPLEPGKGGRPDRFAAHGRGRPRRPCGGLTRHECSTRADPPNASALEPAASRKAPVFRRGGRVFGMA